LGPYTLDVVGPSLTSTKSGLFRLKGDVIVVLSVELWVGGGVVVAVELWVFTMSVHY
jgi:hypothetical protein